MRQRRRLFATTLAFSFLLALAARPLSAQTGQLSGRILDQLLAAVPSARIIAVQTDTGVKREAVSNEDGYYVFTLLPPGAYRVEVQKEGFRPLARTGVVLETGTVSTVDLNLEVGDLNQSITVDASVPLLQQETASVQSVIESRSITNLPLIDRRAAQLVRLNGFVVQSGTGSSFGIAGGRGDNARWYIDGGNAQNLPNIGVATLAYDPPVESLQEFNVAISNYSAELGRTGGGVIQMTTKSGTNEFHGSAYEYFRNDALGRANFLLGAKTNASL